MPDDNVLSELLALDERFFRPDAGRALYDEALDDPALMVVPGPSAPLDRSTALDAAAEAEGGGGWRYHEIHGDPELLELAPEVAAITYEATAQRDGQDPYHALFSSVYVRRGDGWKLALHQQTPILDGGS